MRTVVERRPQRAEVLVVGGGVAGMQAAIVAAETGADVLVLEKADTRRSGSGATGNDHFMCYLPEVHGEDFEAAFRQALDTMEGPLQDHVMFRKLLLGSGEVVRRWEAWGIDMRPYGPDYVFEGHTLPGRMHFHLKFDGSDQKRVFTRVALERGVRVRNRATVVELLSDGEGVCGAICIDSSGDTPRLEAFLAHAVVLCTGDNMRLYPNSTPQALFNVHACPACAGGPALALNAGARLVNMDMIGRVAGPKYFQRSGKGTWMGVLADGAGRPVGPYVKAASRKVGDPFSDVYPQVFADRQKAGLAPTYNDNRSLSEEDLAHMRRCFVTEGDTSINDYMDQHGIDLRRDMVEFGSYDYELGHSGLDIGLDAQTTIRGLFAAGTACGNVRGHITSAAVYGTVAGRSAAAYARACSAEGDVAEDIACGRLAARARLFDAFLSRDEGASWVEVNATLQNIMADYVGGEVRSDGLLTAGLRYIRQLRARALAELSCSNAHELVRTSEVLGLIDIAEAACLCARNRRETRMGHHRVDHPYCNVLLNDCFQTIERDGAGGVRMAFRRNIRTAQGSGGFEDHVIVRHARQEGRGQAMGASDKAADPVGA